MDVLQGQRLCQSWAGTYPAGEGLTALAAHKGSGDEVGIVVALEVHIQKLLLPECFLTLAAGKWLLPGVCALVHYHVALLDGTRERVLIGKYECVSYTSHIPPATHLSAAVVTLITLETLLVFVGLLVLNESIPLVKDSIAVAAFLSHLDERVLLSQVNTCGRQKQANTGRNE